MHQLVTPKKNVVQPRLEIGRPDDKYEKEADAVADRVMRMPSSENLQMKSAGPKPDIQMKCAQCEEEEKLQMKVAENTGNIFRMKHAGGEGKMMAPEHVTRQLMTSSSSGSPLPKSVQREMGSKMGADFSGVKVHTNNTAIQLNKELGAKAFAVGNDIYFNKGQYNPQSADGNKLMAHELVHTVQKTGSFAIQRQSDPQAAVATASLPTADELTARIARCIGIWETNRGGNNPDPKESKLDTVAGISASMATIEQATIPYAITALKRHQTLRDAATPPLTMKELNDAEGRCKGVKKLLKAVDKVKVGTTADEFIKNKASLIKTAGLTNDDVRTMFSAVTLKKTIDSAHGVVEAVKESEKKEKFESEIANINTKDRLGLDEGSLKSYIRNPSNWGENRAAWQRKAVNAMPNNVGSRIEAVATSNNGTALAAAVTRSRVDTELAKSPVPSEKDIVKNVAQQNNPNEAKYGQHVWETYDRLY